MGGHSAAQGGGEGLPHEPEGVFADVHQAPQCLHRLMGGRGDVGKLGGKEQFQVTPRAWRRRENRAPSEQWSQPCLIILGPRTDHRTALPSSTSKETTGDTAGTWESRDWNCPEDSGSPVAGRTLSWVPGAEVRVGALRPRS